MLGGQLWGLQRVEPDFYSFILKPHSAIDVGRFYFFWITLYLLVHLAWDVFSKHTTFFFGKLKNKVSEIFNAVTFASSLYLILIVLEGRHGSLGDDAIIPLIYSGLIGFLNALGAIVPYDHTKISQNKNGDTP